MLAKGANMKNWVKFCIQETTYKLLELTIVKGHAPSYFAYWHKLLISWRDYS